LDLAMKVLRVTNFDTVSSLIHAIKTVMKTNNTFTLQMGPAFVLGAIYM